MARGKKRGGGRRRSGSKSGRSWTMERAVRRVRGSKRKKSNRYSKGEGPKPKAGTRKKYWHPGNRRYQRNPWYRRAKKK